MNIILLTIIFRRIELQSCDKPRGNAKDKKRQLPSPRIAVTRAGRKVQMILSFAIETSGETKKSVRPKVERQFRVSLRATGETEIEMSGILYKMPSGSSD